MADEGSSRDDAKTEEAEETKRAEDKKGAEEKKRAEKERADLSKDALENLQTAAKKLDELADKADKASTGKARITLLAEEARDVRRRVGPAVDDSGS